MLIIVMNLKLYTSLQLTYILGLLLVCGGCSWMWFLPAKHPHQMYGAAVFLGIGTSTISVTSLAMTADLIGDRVVSHKV